MERGLYAPPVAPLKRAWYQGALFGRGRAHAERGARTPVRSSAMYTLIAALVVIVLTIAVPGLFDVEAKWTVLPALVLGIGAYVLLSRRVRQRLESVNAEAGAEMQKLQAMMQQFAQRPVTPAQRNAALKTAGEHIDRAVEAFKKGLFLEPWQFGVGIQLNGQIGSLLFTKTQLVPDASVAAAIPYLEKARVRGRLASVFAGLWPAWAMLGVAYYKGGKESLPKAKALFEQCLPNASREAMFWQIYAWILVKEGETDAAISTLARARDALPNDETVAANLTALQNGKKMSMQAYGDQWYQFGLEAPTAQMSPAMQQQMMQQQMMQQRMAHPRSRPTSKRR